MLFRIRYSHLATFAGNLATGLESGIAIRRALRVGSGSFAKAAGEDWNEVLARVDRGESLSDAMQALEGRLPEFVLPLIKAGEQSGRLTQALHFLADHALTMHKPSEALRNAWLVPVSIMLGGQIAIAGFALFVGQWSFLFKSLRDAVATVGSLFAMYLLAVASPLKILVDHGKLWVPYLGDAERELSVNRFLHVFAWLYGTGGQRMEAMVRLACRCISNEVIREDILRAASAIERGETVGDAFARTTTFTHDEKSELRMADLAGTLAETSARIAGRAGESATFRLTKITVWISKAALILGVMAFLRVVQTLVVYMVLRAAIRAAGTALDQ